MAKRERKQGPPVNIVGSNCRRLRRRFGLSKPQLARRANVTLTTISNVECTAGPWSTATIERLAHTFGVSPAEFWLPPALIDDEDRGLLDWARRPVIPASDVSEDTGT